MRRWTGATKQSKLANDMSDACAQCVWTLLSLRREPEDGRWIMPILPVGRKRAEEVALAAFQFQFLLLY